jgi:L-seryl-tRNA(Ser) seleniumtransferase
METTWQTRLMSESPYRRLPSVDVLADRINGSLTRTLAVEVARRALDLARLEIAAGNEPDVDLLAEGIARVMERAAGTRVINASGVLLHTNLGRATWPESAIAAASEAARHYSNVEIDLDTGERGRRGGQVSMLLEMLTGAEDALVVNNNAAAIFLALSATSSDKAVPVARGELIEIGGSYRLPAVMEASGARLVEVGTTNRTRIGDYQTAVQTHRCGALLKVHPSNYRVTGFTEEVAVDSLSALAAEHGLPLIYDIGSGLLDESSAWLPSWIRGEPGVRQALAAGAGLVTFSGDKLLGGPQAGVIVGDSDLIGTVRSHPLARALRVDSVTYAALSATLTEYLEGPPEGIPFWRFALADSEGLRRRCQPVADAVKGTIEDGASEVGAGSAPGAMIPGPVIRIAGVDDWFDSLLTGDPPILARRESGDLLIDLRAVDPEDDGTIADRLLACR